MGAASYLSPAGVKPRIAVPGDESRLYAAMVLVSILVTRTMAVCQKSMRDR